MTNPQSAPPDQQHQIQQAIRAFEFRPMFINVLGWDNLSGELPVAVDDETYRLRPVAQKRGLVVYGLETAELLPAPLRNTIETQVARSHREHLLVFSDKARTQQVWLWARREIGRPLARRSFEFHQGQSGEALAQRLGTLAFSLEEEEGTTLVEVVGRVRAAFNVERATRKFYDQFRKERDAFEKFVGGIPDVDMSRWYVSVMLNRLMFVTFIQKKGFLDGDPDYLRHRLALVQATYGTDRFDRFYRAFLLRLFHEGLGQPVAERSPEMRALIGRVPYLNGGIFQLHEVEAQYPDIQIPDAAFARIFDFFDGYQWHLDDRPLHNDNEINPDVLGYIFEKYINQKQMGAYYTKEDITEYISKNTIIPFLFDRAREGCAIAFADKGAFEDKGAFADKGALGGGSSVWAVAAANPDRYIYEAVAKGTELPLPAEIAAGLDDVGARGPWNTPTPEEYGLPTEIWRETVARRQRYVEVRARLAAGEITTINDFITYNLDIRQFAQDVVEQAEGADLLTAFWQALTEVSVLDPTCGSGAFLFAALNMLEPLYEAAIQRMREFTAGADWARLHPRHAERFRRVLDDIARHPNETYFIQKSIIVNNLYGVDIMPEAVEIAKLRLFLKLASQVESVDQVEPLPDIDFNIRAGNTLVGYVAREEVRQALAAQQVGDGVRQGQFIFGDDAAALQKIEQDAADVDRLYNRFRALQTGGGAAESPAGDLAATKAELQRRLAALNDQLDRALARQYGVDPANTAALAQWRSSHQPFHWFTEFYGILHGGGFDVVIGNPPYVEYAKVRKEYEVKGYATNKIGNLYAAVIYRSAELLRALGGQLGLIVPLSICGSDRFDWVRQILRDKFSALWLSNYEIFPSKLFDGAFQRLTITLGSRGVGKNSIHSTKIRRWYASERPCLMNLLWYCVVTNAEHSNIFPKLSDVAHREVIAKILSCRQTASIGSSALAEESPNFVFYQEATNYWMKATTRVPYYRKNGMIQPPAHARTKYFPSASSARTAMTTMNSSLFYVWFSSYSDGFHLSDDLVVSFPLAASISTDPVLEQLASKLERSITSNSFRTTRNTKQDLIELESFLMSHSKYLLDEIDTVLATHYGFTDEELDYIINYDIKYRMGDELSGGDDDSDDSDND